MDLRRYDHWIFDMDGTLTVAVHDFESIRRTLGLPPGEPILEAVAKLPAHQAADLMRRLEAIEMAIAREARPGKGAEALLGHLRARGAKLGIVTRNGERIARETLLACGLHAYFEPAHVLGRESGEPKPMPDGVHKLLEIWGAPASRTVMVGDYYFDLVAGRAAGTATVYVDPSGRFEWRDYADLCVVGLDALMDHEATIAPGEA